jgi:hypothetical protein
LEVFSVTTKKTLAQALKDILADDNKISKWDAKALRELILSDGKVSKDEREFLESAIKDNDLDEQAYDILHELLLREEMKFRT